MDIDSAKSHNGTGFGVVYGYNLENYQCGILTIEATIFTAEPQSINASLVYNSNFKQIKIIILLRFSSLHTSEQDPINSLIRPIQANMITLQNQNNEIWFLKIPKVLQKIKFLLSKLVF